MKRLLMIYGALLLGLTMAAAQYSTEQPAQPQESQEYAGSVSCRECHEKFYQLWSTSFHGLAMQPYSQELATAKLTPQTQAIVIGQYSYRADISGAGEVIETGATGEQRYKIAHVMGGKNVFYFLTMLEKGRLQTLPVAYDVHKKEWFDTAASGLRHFPGQENETPVHWKDPLYTFNTACYSCHVSQLSTNYNLQKNEYNTKWAEPGINCETCHGPAGEHNKIAMNTPKGQPLPDIKIISTKTMTKAQRNDLCLSCHAKVTPLTTSYAPKDRFFDHFDLVTLEHPDYYPDGRDLGENYTATTWMMSPCAKSGELDCMHCHTSSGRYRFKKEEDANKACLPCHENRVNNAAEHTHHAADSPANKCVSCHMPMTAFARMNRSDHSMLPPTPAASIRFGSPNACNICHTDKSAEWADQQVRQWHPNDYQDEVLRRAELVDLARKRDWSRLDETLAYITSAKRDEIFATSLIRLIDARTDAKIAAALLKASADTSPLIRAAAIDALAMTPTQESLQAIVTATKDDYRLVRIRAAAALAAYPGLQAGGGYAEAISKANEEFRAFIVSRPDQWTSHYNMGNYHLDRGQYAEAISSYETALTLDPLAVMPMVNSSITYARMGKMEQAEQSLQKALAAAPENAAANFNMGILKAEKGERALAERYLRAALNADPQMAQAAYNLCVMLANDRIEEAVGFCRKAHELQPDDPKYAYTLAFYLNSTGAAEEAIQLLEALMKAHPEQRDARMLLEELSNRKE